MMRDILRSAMVASMISAAINPALAQTKAVLVHGIFSNGETWLGGMTGTSGVNPTNFWQEVQADGFYSPLPPSLSSTSHWRQQANELLDYKETYAIGSSAILVGHSQGGLVSRMSTRSTEPRYETAFAIITTGSPHLGAPIAGHATDVTLKLGWVAFFTYAGLGSLLQPRNDLWGSDLGAKVATLYADLSDIDWRYQEVAGAAGGIAAQIIAHEALADLSGQSGTLATMNASYGEEMVTERRSIAFEMGNGYLGGPLRLTGMPGQEADQKGMDLLFDGIVTWFDALNLLFDPDVGESGYWLPIYIGIGCALDVGWEVALMELWWSSDVVGSSLHDGVVPWFNQVMPGSTTPVMYLSGCTHVMETNQPQCTSWILDQMRQARANREGQ